MDIKRRFFKAYGARFRAHRISLKPTLSQEKFAEFLDQQREAWLKTENLNAEISVEKGFRALHKPWTSRCVNRLENPPSGGGTIHGNLFSDLKAALFLMEFKEPGAVHNPVLLSSKKAVEKYENSSKLLLADFTYPVHGETERLRGIADNLSNPVLFGLDCKMTLKTLEQRWESGWTFSQGRQSKPLRWVHIFGNSGSGKTALLNAFLKSNSTELITAKETENYSGFKKEDYRGAAFVFATSLDLYHGIRTSEDLKQQLDKFCRAVREKSGFATNSETSWRDVFGTLNKNDKRRPFLLIIDGTECLFNRHNGFIQEDSSLAKLIQTWTLDDTGKGVLDPPYSPGLLITAGQLPIQTSDPLMQCFEKNLIENVNIGLDDRFSDEIIAIIEARTNSRIEENKKNCLSKYQLLQSVFEYADQQEDLTAGTLQNRNDALEQTINEILAVSGGSISQSLLKDFCGVLCGEENAKMIGNRIRRMAAKHALLRTNKIFYSKPEVRFCATGVLDDKNLKLFGGFIQAEAQKSGVELSNDQLKPFLYAYSFGDVASMEKYCPPRLRGLLDEWISQHPWLESQIWFSIHHQTANEILKKLPLAKKKSIRTQISKSLRQFFSLLDNSPPRLDLVVQHIFEDENGLAEQMKAYSESTTENVSILMSLKKHSIEQIPAAQIAMGLMHQYGLFGFQTNPQKAVEFFKMASDQGDSFALVELAHAYTNGIGVVKNFKTALDYWFRAANNDSQDARHFLEYLAQTLPSKEKE